MVVVVVVVTVTIRVVVVVVVVVVTAGVVVVVVVGAGVASGVVVVVANESSSPFIRSTDRNRELTLWTWFATTISTIRAETSVIASVARLSIVERRRDF